MSCYEKLKKILDFNNKENTFLNVWKPGIASFFSKIIASILLYPYQLIRARI